MQCNDLLCFEVGRSWGTVHTFHWIYLMTTNKDVRSYTEYNSHSKAGSA